MGGLEIFSMGATAQQVELGWDPSPDTNVTGYAVYYGTNSSNLTTRIDVETNTLASIGNLDAWTTYYFAVTCYTAQNVESEPSTEISFTTPGVLSLVSSTTPGVSLTLNFPVAAGHWYEIQATSDLQTWEVIFQTPLQSISGFSTFQDPADPGTYSQRFYRVVQH